MNSKGGVGKTTTAVTLAAALAMRYRVLLIELDAQGAASRSLGMPSDGMARPLDDVLVGTASMADAIVSSPFEGLDFAAIEPELLSMPTWARRVRRPHLRLREALSDVEETYEYIIFDCAPSFSEINRAALFAADGIISPIVPHYLAYESFRSFAQEVAALQHGPWPVASIWGIVPTMVDTRTRMARDILGRLREEYPDLVLKTEIPVNIRLAEAPQTATSIFSYAIDAAGAKAYWKLATEVIYLAQMRRIMKGLGHVGAQMKRAA